MGTEMRPGENHKKGQIRKFDILINPRWSAVTCFWVNTEGAFQQVVNPFTDIHVKSWVTILQHDFFLKMLPFFCSPLQEALITIVFQIPGMFMIIIRD